MENAKTRIIIEQADGVKREYECESYAAMMFDCVKKTEDGKDQKAEAVVVADHVRGLQIAAVMTRKDNPFGEAYEFLKGVKETKLPWSLRRKLKKLMK